MGRAVLIAMVMSVVGTSAPAAEIDPATLALVKTFRQEFVELQPGHASFPAAYTMGRAEGPAAERPAHRVTLKRPFAIARYEVPQNLWQAVMGVNPSRWKGPRNSVEMLSYDEAVEFCQKVTGLLRDAKLIGQKQTVRLPSEAEWEYAARAGTTTLYSFGNEVADLDAHAWSTRNAAGNDPPVGAKSPNAWQLYDMHGYLWEWCADAWHPDYTGAPLDGSAWDAPGVPQRVTRGGSWHEPPQNCRSAVRLACAPAERDDFIGFRVALSLPA